MANEPHDHVHRLIRSMTRPEKRYFKLYAGRHVLNGQSHYSDLFDAIAAMEVYDERSLYVRFAGAPFLRRFTVIKHRLYDTILASLEAYHADSSVDERLRRSLHQVEILYQRGLNKDAERMLRNVRQTAQAHGKLGARLDVIEWERRLMERTNYGGVDESQLQDVAREAQALREEWEQLDKLWELKARSFILLYRRGKARNERSAHDMALLAAHPLLQEDEIARSPKARFMRDHIRGALAFAMNDLPLCERCLSDNDLLLDKEASFFKDEPNLRLSVMSNLAYVRMRAGRYADALEGLKRVKRLPLQMTEAPNADLEVKIFSMTTDLELAILCRMGEFNKAIEKLPTIEAALDRYGAALSGIRKASIRFQAAWASLGAGCHDDAGRWCGALLNERGAEEHEEIFAMGRILRMLIMLESDKADLLRYEVRNVERFLKAHDRYHRFERAVIQYVKSRTAEPATTAARSATLLRALEALESDPLEGAVFDVFDLRCYARSRAIGQSMEQIARSQVIVSAAGTQTVPSGKRRAA